MLIRNFVDKFIQEPNKIKATSERDFYRKKEELWDKQVSKLQSELLLASNQLVKFAETQKQLAEA